MSMRTAIVPAAGLGTRFLPITKTVPKPLLPVVDTPGIELVASEAAHAGASRMVVVTSPGQEAVTDYFRPQPELEAALAERGKQQMLDRVRRTSSLIDVEQAVQREPLGLGHAVGCAEQHLTEADDAVAVLLPDDLILPHGVLDRMAKVRAEHGGSVTCAFQVTRDEIGAYGALQVTDTEDDDVKRVHGVVEKPDPAEAPSTLAIVGRYLLDRAVFDALRRINPGAGGELQLTDAIALLIADGHPVHAVVHRTGRHDLGTPVGMLKAAVDFALDRPDCGPELAAWLRGRV